MFASCIDPIPGSFFFNLYCLCLANKHSKTKCSSEENLYQGLQKKIYVGLFYHGFIDRMPNSESNHLAPPMNINSLDGFKLEQQMRVEKVVLL